MKICVVGGMIDAKLYSKLAPLQESELVSKIHLVRRLPYPANKALKQDPRYKKLISHSVPGLLRKFLPLAELWRLSQLFWICLWHRPKVLVAFGTTPHGVYVWLVGKLFRIKTVQHIMGKNDLRLTFDGQRGKNLTLRAVRAADLVAVRGRPMIQYLTQHGVEDSRIFIPQNIHDFSLFQAASNNNAPEPEFELIYVGLLSAYKRIDLLLDSFAATDPTQHNKKLLLIGDGPERDRLLQQATGLGIAQQVTFQGKVDFNELPVWFNKARSFIMTSQGEGLPMAMIEAMSCGLPAIVANDADIAEIAQHEHNALLVSDWQANLFADAIRRLRDDQGLYNELKNNALNIRDQKQQEYSLDFQSRLWTDKLNSLSS